MFFLVLLEISFHGGLTFNVDRAQSHGLKLAEITWLVEVSGIANICGRIIFGQLADIFGPRKYILITIIMLVFIIAWAVSVLATTMAWQTVWFGIFGLLNGANSTFSNVIVK